MSYHEKQEIWEDIKSVLEHVVHGIETNNSQEIKEWSNHIIHNAGIFQDTHSIRTGIIVYALSKIHEKFKFKNDAVWSRFWTEILTNSKNMIRSIESNNISEVEKGFRIITRAIDKADKKFSLYVQDVLEEAKVKKAGKAYEHGLSLGVVAELMGISKWDAMQYLGHTKSENKEFVTEHIDERFSYTKKIMKKKGGKQ